MEAEDRPYCRNLLLDALGLEAPADLPEAPRPYEGETATPIMNALCAFA